MTHEITTAYEPIDLCACFDMLYFPPEEFLEECRIYWLNRNPFHGTIERRIGNTWFTIETECAELRSYPTRSSGLFFLTKILGKGAVVHDRDKKLC